MTTIDQQNIILNLFLPSALAIITATEIFTGTDRNTDTIYYSETETAIATTLHELCLTAYSSSQLD